MGQQGSDSVELEPKLPGNLTDQQPGDNRRGGQNSGAVGAGQHSTIQPCRIKEIGVAHTDRPGRIGLETPQQRLAEQQQCRHLVLGHSLFKCKFSGLARESAGNTGGRNCSERGRAGAGLNAEQGWSDKTFANRFRARSSSPLYFRILRREPAIFICPAAALGAA